MPNEITKPNKIGLKGFASRVAQVNKETSLTADVNLPNRIGLMLDNSGSMSESSNYVSGAKSKIDLLKDAVQGFVNACDFTNTSVALYAIPVDSNTIHLTQQSALLILGALQLDASGGTPLGATMRSILEQEPLTRGVIVSDGQATDSNLCFDIAKQFKLADIPCDCIHIGDSTSGEDTLTQIAEITGGIFLKFKDVSQFAKAMRYLSPRYRALLASGDAKALLGADEVKGAKP